MFGKKVLKKTNKVEPNFSTNPLSILEPFQDVVDETLDIDWLDLENQDFSELGINKSNASEAVALVIRASRRGVVSLCAEVADLLKEKNQIESVVEEQRMEIATLKENQFQARSSSPVPPETSDFALQTVQENECQTVTTVDTAIQTEDIVLSCARIKSLDESAIPVRPTTEIAGVKFDCGSDYMLQCACPELTTSSTQNPVLATKGTNTEDGTKLYSQYGYFEHNRLDTRLKSLETKHKSLKTEAKEKTNKTTKLELELDKAKKEIVCLQKAIQEMQATEFDKLKEQEQMKLAETFSLDVQNTLDSIDETSDEDEQSEKNVNIVIREGKRNREFITIGSGRTNVSMRSSIFPGPILGCKCQMCNAFFRSSGILGFACTPYVTDSSGKNPILKDLKKLVSLQNSKLQIHPNDKVLLHNRKTGVVRYVGHLDGSGLSSVVYAGVELDQPGGKHDGYLSGKRYFFAPRNHGMFLPLQDILCTIEQKKSIPEPQRRHSVTGQFVNNKSKKGVIKPQALKRNSRGSLSRSRTSSELDSSTKLPLVSTK